MARVTVPVSMAGGDLAPIEEGLATVTSGLATVVSDLGTVESDLATVANCSNNGANFSPASSDTVGNVGSYITFS